MACFYFFLLEYHHVKKQRGFMIMSVYSLVKLQVAQHSHRFTDSGRTPSVTEGCRGTSSRAPWGSTRSSWSCGRWCRVRAGGSCASPWRGGTGCAGTSLWGSTGSSPCFLHTQQTKVNYFPQKNGRYHSRYAIPVLRKNDLGCSSRIRIFFHPGYRKQKSTGSRIRIRNTVGYSRRYTWNCVQNRNNVLEGTVGRRISKCISSESV